ncbi:hypothetical protein Hamer_G006230 [Homarus americanus]|uniref:Uncharacterized protein n=1 Tax=Homarus americanus TaxID=6706 RepID=A0A8J5JNK4_HOMAM|nr:hypothetical protein Hamer_G006227 [Homarus americanus]KAG7158862.1 hypothetical protein Hamer_G006230 [Homarus americanus]
MLHGYWFSGYGYSKSSRSQMRNSGDIRVDPTGGQNPSNALVFSSSRQVLPFRYSQVPEGDKFYTPTQYSTYGVSTNVYICLLPQTRALFSR